MRLKYPIVAYRVLYNIFLSIENKLSNFQYWGFDKLGVRVLSKTMDYASKIDRKGGFPR